MRLPILLALCLSSPAALAEAGAGDLGGVWTGWQCPAGVRLDPGKCANFVLELFQKDGKLCGTHVYATAGASQMDEGGEMPSLIGEVADGAAAVTVQSGRSPARIRAELKLANGRLQWRRLEGEGDFLLPPAMQLTRSRHKSLRTPVLERQLRTAWFPIFSMTSVSADPAPQANPPAPVRGRD